jgi:hypothetical protein
MLSCWGFFLERVVSEEGSSFSVCLLPYGKRLNDCLIGTALPVLILCCTKYVWPKSPLDFEKKKTFGVQNSN